MVKEAWREGPGFFQLARNSQMQRSAARSNHYTDGAALSADVVARRTPRRDGAGGHSGFGSWIASQRGHHPRKLIM